MRTFPITNLLAHALYYFSVGYEYTMEKVELYLAGRAEKKRRREALR